MYVYKFIKVKKPSTKIILLTFDILITCDFFKVGMTFWDLFLNITTLTPVDYKEIC